ncbi:MAG: signal peptidase II [Candidatus Competibacteraceae bacterium]
MLKWLWLSGLVIALDQVSKWLAEQVLLPGQPVPVLSFFNLTLLYNTGAAFSFLAQAGGWQHWFFLLLSLTISIALVIWLARLQRGQTLLAIALSLILGGAVGNLIDRIVHGHVIDFIQLYYQRWYWPAFNIADSAITVGAVLLVLDNLLYGAGRRMTRSTHKESI